MLVAEGDARADDAGRGVNPLGDETLDAIAEWWTPGTCRCDPAWREA